MDFSAHAWFCSPLRLTVFEEATDDVRHAIDPMPRPSLFTEMCEENFDICQPHLLERLASRVFQELGQLAPRGGDGRLRQASLFCHVPTVRIEFGLMRSWRTSWLLQPPGEAQPTASDVTKFLLCRLRTGCHCVEELPVRPFRRGPLYYCALHLTRIVQIHADSRTIQHTCVRAQAMQSGTACSEVFQVSE